MTLPPTGTVPVLGYRLFYRTFGDATDRPPVLGLHGGPGASHDYLTPLGDLAGRGLRVVLFDQLGCGRSEIPPGTELFSLEHHVAETEGIRLALGLGRVHVVGSSYGGTLALAYTLAHPDAVASLTTVGGLASVPLAREEMARLRGELPREVRATLDRCEATGATDSPDYLAAARVFYQRYLCRLDPWPADFDRSMRDAASHPVYPHMNGPSEFTITGTIRDIDLSPQLGKIRAPTLVLGGRFDEVTPRVAAQIRDGIPGARGVTFEGSSHVPFWEERARFFDVLGAFLDDVDGVRSGPPAPPM